MIGEIKLGPLGEEIVLTPHGRTFTIQNNEYSRQARTANSRLVKDLREGSPKKTFTLSYSLIDGNELDSMIALYELEIELSFLIYTTDFVYDQYDVLMDPIDKERVLFAGDGLWSNVKIVLNEV